MWSTNHDYCFKQPFKHIDNTADKSSGLVHKIVRTSDYFIQQL